MRNTKARFQNQLDLYAEECVGNFCLLHSLNHDQVEVTKTPVDLDTIEPNVSFPYTVTVASKADATLNATYNKHFVHSGYANLT